MYGRSYLATLSCVTVLGCFGHWYASLLYVVPVALIVGALGVQHLRDRRAGIVGPHRHDDDELDAMLESSDASSQRPGYARSST
jgi:hypothetical protein